MSLIAVKNLLTATLPKYLASLPIPDTVGELAKLSQADAIALITPVVTLVVLVFTFRGKCAGGAAPSSSTVFRSLCEGTWCTQPSPHPGRHHKKIVTVSLAQQQM